MSDQSIKIKAARLKRPERILLSDAIGALQVNSEAAKIIDEEVFTQRGASFEMLIGPHERVLRRGILWANQALSSSHQLHEQPPRGCIYDEFGLICRISTSEIFLAPFLSYQSWGEMQYYIQYSLSITKLFEEGYCAYGTSLDQLREWPLIDRLDSESGADVD
jgi:hypothetical protein